MPGPTSFSSFGPAFNALVPDPFRELIGSYLYLRYGTYPSKFWSKLKAN